jgi:hypothetical protein
MLFAPTLSPSGTLFDSWELIGRRPETIVSSAQVWGRVGDGWALTEAEFRRR